MKKRKSEFTVLMPVLKSKVIFLFGAAGKDFAIPAVIPAEHFEGNYAGRTLYKRTAEDVYAFTVVIHVKERERLGVLVHELHHAQSFILDAMGMQADHNNDEIGAYIVQHLFEEVVSWMHN